MSRLFVLISVLGASLVLAAGQYYALEYFLYWRYWWFDIVMHAGGGLIIGLSLYAFGVRRLVTLSIAVLCVGVAWEVFENLIGFTLYQNDIVVDTLQDLGMDVVGGALAYGIMQWWDKKYHLPSPVVPAASPGQIS